MTYSDKRNLFGGGILMLVVTAGVMVFLMPSSSVIFTALWPSTFETTAITTAISAVVSAILMATMYSGALDTANSTKYYMVQPSMEEVIFRFNAIIIVHALSLKTPYIAVLCIVQGLVFAILHPNGYIKHAILGMVWFVAAYYGGIIPAMIGHTVSSFTFRVRARAHHGWYDED